MDEPETAIVGSSHVGGAMNYPSTTQALFALIVMIIVLLFILVYCCWGTFTCARQDNASAPTTEDGTGSNPQQGVRHILRGSHTVIVPINNMIYVGDPETHQIYQIPLDRDKPPSYTEVFRTDPPPPYRPDTMASESGLSSSTTTQREQQDNRTVPPERPPTYEECLSAAADELGAEQSLGATSEPSQQQRQQEVTTASGTSTVTESPPSPEPKPTQEIRESSPPRRDLILTVSTLPREVERHAEERPSTAPTGPQYLQSAKSH